MWATAVQPDGLPRPCAGRKSRDGLNRQRCGPQRRRGKKEGREGSLNTAVDPSRRSSTPLDPFGGVGRRDPLSFRYPGTRLLNVLTPPRCCSPCCCSCGPASASARRTARRRKASVGRPTIFLKTKKTSFYVLFSPFSLHRSLSLYFFFWRRLLCARAFESAVSTFTFLPCVIVRYVANPAKQTRLPRWENTRAFSPLSEGIYFFISVILHAPSGSVAVITRDSELGSFP